MKYKIIVDKQPRTNPSLSKKIYEIDIEELRYKGDIKDTLVITKNEDYVIRRLSLSEYHVLSVLTTPIIESLKDINIELFEGDNYIYIYDETGNRFYAEYLINNEFNDLYALNSEVNSKIEQLASSIEISVNSKLESYSSKEETNAAINVSANSINQRVSEITSETNSAIEVLDNNIKNVENSIESIGDNLTTINENYTNLEQTINGWDFNIVTDIKKQLEDGTVVSNEVRTTSVNISDEGISVGKSGSQIKSLLDNEGLYVNNENIDKENPDNNLLKADINGVTTENLYVRTYATLGYHRFEKYNKNNEQRTGLFWVGGAKGGNFNN